MNQADEDSPFYKGILVMFINLPKDLRIIIFRTLLCVYEVKYCQCNHNNITALIGLNQIILPCLKKYKISFIQPNWQVIRAPGNNPVTFIHMGHPGIGREVHCCMTDDRRIIT